MSYSVGEYIDLTHLNKKQEVLPSASKKSERPTFSEKLIKVGTSFTFENVEGKLRAARRINVVFA